MNFYIKHKRIQTAYEAGSNSVKRIIRILYARFAEDSAWVENARCHRWNGDLLVKKPECKHELPFGFAAKTVVDAPSGIKFLDVIYKIPLNEKTVFSVKLFRYTWILKRVTYI